MLGRLITFLLLTLTCCAPLPAQLTLGAYFDALFFDSRAKRLEDFAPLKDAGFLRLASNFTPDDDPILDLCAKGGVKVLFSPNGVSEAQEAAFFAKYAAAIDSYMVLDDANTFPGGKAAVVAKVTAARARLPAGVKTFLTFGKNATAAEWANTAEIAGLQLYGYGEAAPGGTLKAWNWTYVQAWRAAHTGKLWVHPYLGKRAAPFFAQYPTTADGKVLAPDPFLSAEEYVPLAYNEAAIWTSLCAGADDILFYSAYSISQPYPVFSYRIAKRRDLLPGYKSVLARVRFYEKYLAGVRSPFDQGTVVGAAWTLPSGESLTVRVDTDEFDPHVYFQVSGP